MKLESGRSRKRAFTATEASRKNILVGASGRNEETKDPGWIRDSASHLESPLIRPLATEVPGEAQGSQGPRKRILTKRDSTSF